MSAADKRLICFDLGGVLVRICRSWEEGLHAAGLDADRGWTPADSGGAHHDLVTAYTVGAINDDAFFEGLACVSGGAYSASDFRAIHAAWIIGEYPGSAETLGELRAAGLTLACLSNTNGSHWGTMLGWPSLRALHHRHASHLLGVAKPEPAIYSKCAAACGAAPERIVFFDDLVENIDAARAVGWDAVLVDSAGDPAAQIRRTLGERGLV